MDGDGTPRGEDLGIDEDRLGRPGDRRVDVDVALEQLLLEQLVQLVGVELEADELHLLLAAQRALRHPAFDLQRAQDDRTHRELLQGRAELARLDLGVDPLELEVELAILEALLADPRVGLGRGEGEGAGPVHEIDGEAGSDPRHRHAQALGGLLEAEAGREREVDLGGPLARDGVDAAIHAEVRQVDARAVGLVDGEVDASEVELLDHDVGVAFLLGRRLGWPRLDERFDVEASVLVFGELQREPVEADLSQRDLTVEERAPVGGDVQAIEGHHLVIRLVRDAQPREGEVAEEGEVEISDGERAVEALAHPRLEDVADLALAGPRVQIAEGDHDEHQRHEERDPHAAQDPPPEGARLGLRRGFLVLRHLA